MNVTTPFGPAKIVSFRFNLILEFQCEFQDGTKKWLHHEIYLNGKQL